MKIKPILYFILSLVPVILLGGYNQYRSLDLSVWHFISWKIVSQVIPLMVSAVVSGLLCRYLLKKDITVSLIYSTFTFLCLLPITTTAIEVFLTFLLGSLISLAKINLKNHLFYLNPAVAARLLIFLLHFPLVRVDAMSGATPLAYCHIMLETGRNCGAPSLFSLFIGHWQGALGETSKLGIVIGGLILISCRLIRVQIILYAFAGAALSWLILVYPLGYALQLPSFITYLLMGSFLFGVVFMTTDMFTRCLSTFEYAAYGVLVGFLCILLRVVTPFPEATLLSLIISQLLLLIYTVLAVKPHPAH